MDLQNDPANAQLIRQTSETFLGMSLGPRGMFWAVMALFGPPGTPRKSALFQKRGRKRMKELGKVTFMSPARCGRFGVNGSSLARFVPEIRPFEKKGLV